jgi:AcrR family transcriptional regulator
MTDLVTSVSAERDALAERILDATVEQVALSGFQRLALEDVARRAGTARVTLYRRFGSRDALLEAMAVRETQRFIEALAAAAADLETLEDRGVEAFVVGLRFMRAHPVARRAIDAEREAIIEYLEADGARLLTMSRDFVAGALRAEGRGGRRAPELAETLVRIFVSFLLVPTSDVDLDDERATRAYARRCIAPLLGTRA